MRQAATVGVAVLAAGILTMAAPLVLPRNMFGELGHGDGMGLIGLVLIGGVIAVTGFVMLIVTVISSAATSNGQHVGDEATSPSEDNG